jgi:GTP-binding protein
MLDEELEAEMKQQLPSDLPVIFISSVAQRGLAELKDLVYKEIVR